MILSIARLVVQAFGALIVAASLAAGLLFGGFLIYGA